MNSEIYEKTKEELKILYREIYLAKSQYIIFLNLYNDLLRLNSSDKLIYTKKAVFDALEYSVFLKLSKIYDEDKTAQSITLYNILNRIQCNRELNKLNKRIIKYVEKNLEKIKEKGSKIKFFRDKNIAHLDKKYKIGLKGLHQDCPLTLDDLEELINIAYNIIKSLLKLVFSEDYGNDKDFEFIQLECEKCKNELYN